MSRHARPHYRPGLGWILGVAFEDTLTRPVRLAQGFTFVRCHGSPRASSPHGLTAPGLASLRRRYCVQLPLARGCYQLAPRRTFTSNPVPMPGTPIRATPSRRRGSSGRIARTHFALRRNAPKTVAFMAVQTVQITRSTPRAHRLSSRRNRTDRGGGECGIYVQPNEPVHGRPSGAS